MGRSIGAVVAGTILWSILWVGGAQVASTIRPGAFTPAGAAAGTGVSLFFLGFSVVVSLLSGFVTALIAGRNEVAHGMGVGLVLFALGLFFEISSWHLSPVWYHLVFLALLLPANVAGAALRGRGRGVAVAG